MSHAPSIKLNDGNSMPALAFGVGTSIGRPWGNAEDVSNVSKLVCAALQSGYRHLDTAEEYLNEEDVGEGIKLSGIPRKDIFITAKNLSEEGASTEDALRTSLKKLGVEYIDLYLIHNNFFAKTEADLQRKWAEMEAVHAKGLVKSIGVSNIERQHIETILKTAKIRPAVNQIELHPYLQRPHVMPWLKEQNIAVACYSPLTPILDGSPGPADDVIQSLAAKYKVGKADVCLQWAVDQGYAVITTSSKVERLQASAKTLSTFQLNKEEISQVSTEGKKKDFNKFWSYFSAAGADK